MKTLFVLILIQIGSFYNLTSEEYNKKFSGVIISGQDIRLCRKVMEANNIETRTQIEQYPSYSAKIQKYLVFPIAKKAKVDELMKKLKTKKRITNYCLASFFEIEKKFFPPLSEIDKLKIRREGEMLDLKIQRSKDNIFFRF